MRLQILGLSWQNKNIHLISMKKCADWPGEFFHITHMETKNVRCLGGM